MSDHSTEPTGKRANASGLEPRAFTVNDTLKLLSISRSHMYQLAIKGQLRIVKIGNRTLVPATEIERLINGGTTHD
jgi:excisionase family DNA binding protein